MESSFRLSHGRAQFHGATIAFAKKIGFGLREKPIAATPPPSPVEIEAATVSPVSADPIAVVTVEPTSGTKRKAKTKTKTKGKSESESKVAVAPEATAKRKSGRARKATA